MSQCTAIEPTTPSPQNPTTEARQVLRLALRWALRRQAGQEALTRLPKSLQAAISQEVAGEDLPLERLQQREWALEIALWLEKSAYLLLISPGCQRPGLSGWSLDVIPEHQSYRMSPRDPHYEGVSLGFFETKEAAMRAAATWELPFLEWALASAEECHFHTPATAA